MWFAVTALNAPGQRDDPGEPGARSAKAAAPQVEPPGATMDLGPWEDWPWCLMGLVPEATAAANAGVPAEIIWHFELVAP